MQLPFKHSDYSKKYSTCGWIWEPINQFKVALAEAIYSHFVNSHFINSHFVNIGIGDGELTKSRTQKLTKYIELEN